MDNTRERLIDSALKLFLSQGIYWTCPFKTGRQLPVKLMLSPSA